MGLCIDALPRPAGHDEAAASVPRGAATQPPPTDANHLFANNVRFLSMAAIIAIHTMGLFALMRPQVSAPLAFLCAIQSLKFGTIAFFLIAGFLFGERIDQYSSIQYYARRLKNVFLPWTVWYVVDCSLAIAAGFVHKRISLHSGNLLGPIYMSYSKGLLDSAYWFVPNLMIALAVLLAFRRMLRDVRIGLVFLLISLFYAANIYAGWIPVRHTEAVFGFVFYLWLGAWAAWYFPRIEKRLARIPAAVIVTAILATGALAVGEAKLLSSLHSVDALNSLRITNQLYSLVFVLAIVKLKRATWPRFVDVRAHTFGLYLTHAIALSLCGAVLKRILPHPLWTVFFKSAPGIVLSLLAAFVVVYGGCLILVRFLLSCSWLRWTVGLAGSPRAATVARNIAARAAAGGDLAIALQVRPKGLTPAAGHD